MDSFSDIININHEFNQYQINFYFELGNGGAFMKRMKKLTSIGLVLAMTVGLLAGCSGGSNGSGAVPMRQAARAVM